MRTVLLCVLLSTLLSPSLCWTVELEPYDNIPMYTEQNISVRLIMQAADQVELNTFQHLVLQLRLREDESWAVTLITDNITFDYRDIRRSVAKTVTVRGDVIGEKTLEIWKDSTLLHTENIIVVMSDRTLNDLFTLIMIVMVVANTINMGAQLDIEIIKEVFKKPVGPFVGFLSQFGFMPLFSFFIGWAITDDKLFRLGLFVLGCCPGGTGSNFWTLLLNGDINMSITMTFMSTIMALAFMPIWIFLLGPFIVDDSLVIPFSQLITSLVSLILPTALGMWIRWKWSKSARILDKIIVPFTLLTVLFILTAGVYINIFIFLLMTPAMFLAGFIVAIAGYLFGAGLAKLFKLNRGQIVAVAIETSFQNGTIAFILLKISLQEPYGELAAVAPVAQLMVTGLPLWLIFFALKFYQKCVKKKKDQHSETATGYEKVAKEKDTLKIDSQKPIV